MDNNKKNKVETTIKKSTNKESEFCDFREEKNKKKRIILCTIIVTTLILIIVFILLYIKNNYTAETFLDKNITNINESLNNIIDTLNINDYNKLQGPTTTQGKIKFETTSIKLKDLNNLSLEYKTNTDLKNMYIDYDITLSQKENANLNIQGILNNNKIYLTSKDITDKTYYYNLPNEDIFKNINEISNIKNIKEIITGILNCLNISLKQSKMTTNYNGLNITYTYEINDNNKELVEKTFIDSIKKDKNVMNYLNISKDDLNSSININNIKLEITINIFNNSIQNFIITMPDERYTGEKLSNNKLKVSSSKNNEYYEIEYSDKKIGITYFENDKSIDELKIESYKNNLTINYSYNEISLNINITDKLIKGTYKTNEITSNIDFEITNNNSLNLDGTITIKTNTDDYKLIITNNTTYKESMDKKDITNAINIENIQENDLNNIIANGYQKLQEFDAINLINGISSIISNEAL